MADINAKVREALKQPSEVHGATSTTVVRKKVIAEREAFLARHKESLQAKHEAELVAHEEEIRARCGGWGPAGGTAVVVGWLVGGSGVRGFG